MHPRAQSISQVYSVADYQSLPHLCTDELVDSNVVERLKRPLPSRFKTPGLPISNGDQTPEVANAHLRQRS